MEKKKRKEDKGYQNLRLKKIPRDRDSDKRGADIKGN